VLEGWRIRKKRNRVKECAKEKERAIEREGEWKEF
jgi:hypothetical protein